MSKTIMHEGKPYHVVTNGHLHELKALAELPQAVREHEFDYCDDADYDEWTPRFFKYRNSWYDSHEFERGSYAVLFLGYDAWQTQSYFDCVAIGYFDKDGYEYDNAVRVAHIHW